MEPFQEPRINLPGNRSISQEQLRKHPSSWLACKKSKIALKKTEKIHGLKLQCWTTHNTTKSLTQPIGLLSLKPDVYRLYLRFFDRTWMQRTDEIFCRYQKYTINYTQNSYKAGNEKRKCNYIYILNRRQTLNKIVVV